jgi:predicted kinase
LNSIEAEYSADERDSSSGCELLPALPLCYKPYMRKWMRERLKRRKKSEEGKPPAEPAQAPLQPAYFDARETPAAEPVHETESEPDPAASEHAPESSPAVEAKTDTASASTGPRRRRRERGGRGRRGKSGRASAPAAPAPDAPIAVEGAEEPPPLLAAAPLEIPAAPPRPPKGAVILAIGLPGSGKSSWFKRNNITPLSSDLLRMLLFDDAQEQRFQDLVFSNLRSMLKARLIARRPLNYVDATNLTPHERHSWVKLAKDYGYDVQAVFFDVPVEVCLERNRRRDRVVNEDVMRRMAAKLKPPTFEEGFSKVTVVRVKKKEAEAS